MRSPRERDRRRVCECGRGGGCAPAPAQRLRVGARVREVGNRPEIQSLHLHLLTILKLPQPRAPFPRDLFHAAPSRSRAAVLTAPHAEQARTKKARPVHLRTPQPHDTWRPPEGGKGHQPASSCRCRRPEPGLGSRQPHVTLPRPAREPPTAWCCRKAPASRREPSRVNNHHGPRGAPRSPALSRSPAGI